MTRSALASARIAEPSAAPSDCRRRPFSETEVVAVWSKGRPIPFHDPSIWRRDDFGRVLHRRALNLADHPYGWEIDHIVALAQGGTNALHNLRPLKCRTDRRAGGILGAILAGS